MSYLIESIPRDSCADIEYNQYTNEIDLKAKIEDLIFNGQTYTVYKEIKTKVKITIEVE